MVNDPKDIALAVKMSFSPLTSNNDNDKANEDASGGKRISAEDLEDTFDELGLELVDETAQPEDDDERRELICSIAVIAGQREEEEPS